MYTPPKKNAEKSGFFCFEDPNKADVSMKFFNHVVMILIY